MLLPRDMTDAGLGIFAICFLVVSVPVETLYSWRNGITDPYYLVKVCGWALLVFGVMQLRKVRPARGLVFLAAGWGWFAANFWRAVADRFSHIAAGQTLRLSSAELWFASGCLIISLIGLSWCLVLTSRTR